MKSLFTLVLVILVAISPSVASQDWITEEVLTQLTEIRQELSALREEVKELKLTASEGEPGGNAAFQLDQDRVVPMLGDADASIVVVEFSDYECPYCRRHTQQTLPLLKKNYIEAGRIQYTLMDFPLGFHSLAKPAAIAARCAAAQSSEAYWAFHNQFFSGEANALAEENYKDIAAGENLDLTQFTTCLNDSSVAAAVDADMSYGGSMGVSGTPAFFIGIKQGDQLVDVQFLSGAQPYSVFSQVIDRLLNKT